MKDLLKGQQVILAAVDPEEISKHWAEWNRDSEFKRLLDASPTRLHSAKAIKEWVEKSLKEEEHSLFWFTIRAREDQRLLGDISLFITNWNHREAFVGLGIGPRDFWGKGYGTEAMKLILEYAFVELNLQRVTLNVFEYNSRAIRSYEKVGFRHEGRLRDYLLREGKRWDMLYMGILCEEWLSQFKNSE